MSNKIKLDILDNVAETLFITLYAKSVETKRKNPLIRDEKACELIEKIDYDFSKYKNSPASIAGVAIRSNHFDNMVRKFIKGHLNPIVVLVGCGLDTRVQRLGNIANKALFYELDIEEVINARSILLPPKENECYMVASLLDTEWMDNLKKKHPNGNFIFVIEGVLMYFNKADNKHFFTEIAKRFNSAEIHFDMLNKWFSTKSSKHETVRKTNAEFKFGIDDEKEIEQWHPNLRFKESYLFTEFKGWRKMGFFVSTLMILIPLFKKGSQLLIYQVGENR